MSAIGLESSIQKLKERLPENASVSRRLLDSVVEKSSTGGEIDAGDLLGILFDAVIDLELKMCGNEVVGDSPDDITVPLRIAGKTYQFSPASIRTWSEQQGGSQKR